MMSNRSLLRLYLLKFLHAKIVKATMEKTIKIGRAKFRKASVAQAMKHDMAISKTDKMTIAGMLTNIFWKRGLL